jgi:hypothetical protein
MDQLKALVATSPAAVRDFYGVTSSWMEADMKGKCYLSSIIFECHLSLGQ